MRRIVLESVRLSRGIDADRWLDPFAYDTISPFLKVVVGRCCVNIINGVHIDAVASVPFVEVLLNPYTTRS
jgi:hypothetical protein